MMARAPFLQLAVAAILVVLATNLSSTGATTAEKGRVVDCSAFTRNRDCSPWGLKGDTINPAFTYDYPDSPLQHCRGVINNFYYFKLINFAADLETSVLLRALKAVSEATWNAWAHFHPTATDTLGQLVKEPKRRVAPQERTIVNKNIAIAYALTRLTVNILPSAAQDAQDLLTNLVASTNLTGFETDPNPATPQGIGNLVASELIASLKADGWNSEGDMSPRNTFPFADYTAYQPINSEYKITYPTRYQPLLETDLRGYFTKQLHTTPHLRSPKIKLWALNQTFVQNRKIPAPWNPSVQGEKFLEYYKGNISLVLNASANLNTTQKLITEFFDNKIVSFGGFERWFAWKNDWCQDDFVQYDQLSSCLHDATVLAWKEKIRVDAIRPASAIRYLADMGQLPQSIKGWGGPEGDYKTVSMNPYHWRSYMRTMPHSEYPSGTSCVCQVWAEWTTLFQKGNDTLDLPLTWEKGCSSVEKGVTPEAQFSHTFKTISGALKTCSQSRIWAGVHFQNSLTGGQALCSGVAQQCYNKVQRLLKGDPK